jgi:hypothetical protein
MRAAAAVWLAALAAAPTVHAVELQLHYSAIQGILAQQYFTGDGRRYVRGSSATRCDYAYLENPKVSGQDGRLLVKARFSGRSAMGLFGRCIGLGDSFDMVITATPYYAAGAVSLREVRIDTLGRDSYYIRRVRQAMGPSLEKTFQYKLYDDARRILEEKREQAPFHQELKKFDVSRIAVTGDALVLTLDFSLAVK